MRPNPGCQAPEQKYSGVFDLSTIVIASRAREHGVRRFGSADDAEGSAFKAELPGGVGPFRHFEVDQAHCQLLHRRVVEPILGALWDPQSTSKWAYDPACDRGILYKQAEKPGYKYFLPPNGLKVPPGCAGT